MLCSKEHNIVWQREPELDSAIWRGTRQKEETYIKPIKQTSFPQGKWNHLTSMEGRGSLGRSRKFRSRVRNVDCKSGKPAWTTQKMVRQIGVVGYKNTPQIQEKKGALAPLAPPLNLPLVATPSDNTPIINNIQSPLKPLWHGQSHVTLAWVAAKEYCFNFILTVKDIKK